MTRRSMDIGSRQLKHRLLKVRHGIVRCITIMSMPGTLRKYPERRLCDTAKRAGITLADLRELVFERAPFVVIDSGSEADITASVLMQVVALAGELEPKQILRLIRSRHRHTHRPASSPGA
jgi:hypothetical protein